MREKLNVENIVILSLYPGEHGWAGATQEAGRSQQVGDGVDLVHFHTKIKEIISKMFTS